MIVWALLSHIVLSLQCPQFKCKVDSVKFPDSSYCIHTVGSVHYLNPCSNTDYSCVVNLGSFNNETKCTYSAYPVIGAQLPGMICEYSSDCIQNTQCVNNTCVGTKYGGCNSNYDCDVGLYCNSNYQCVAQILVNSYGCRRDSDCVNSAGCTMISNNVNYNQCVQYLSLMPSFVENTNALLCVYPFIVNNDCTAKPPESTKLPMECRSNSDCLYQNGGITLQGQCVCGINSYGKSYCSLLPGDQPYVSYYKYLKQWTYSTNILNCHTNARFDPRCIIQHWGKKKAYYLLAAQYYAYYYEYLYGANDCALKIFSSNYRLYTLETSASSILLISFFYIFS